MSKERSLKIENVAIGDTNDCYVIAEIGHNHQGDVERCKKLFYEAKQAGAHAVKLQKRDNKSLYTKELYNKAYDSEHSYGKTYGEHREALEFGKKEYEELKKYAKELGITFFATAFDKISADFLEELDFPAYKIASGDVKNIPLIRHIAKFNKPIIVSTGGASLEDIDRVYREILPLNDQLCILQCTAMYPADFSKLDIRVIETFRSRYPEVVIGLSSHDIGIAISLAAYMLGARVVEKHFTLDKTLKGTDHKFSLDPLGMRNLVNELRNIRLAVGDGIKKVHQDEDIPLIKMGKSLYAAQDLKAGHILREQDIAIKSPGIGLPPYEMDSLIGKVLRNDLKEDELFTKEMLLSKENKARI